MVQLHWELKNHCQHFGRAGFSMLGYDPGKDVNLWGRHQSFNFDSLAVDQTEAAFQEELPRRQYPFKDGVPFGKFFDLVANVTPATKTMLAEQISKLTLEKQLSIKSEKGDRKRNGVLIANDDIIICPRQKPIIFP